MTKKLTLGDYRFLAIFLGGEINNLALAFIEAKIREQGEDMAVEADESQMITMIASLLQLNGRQL